MNEIIHLLIVSRVFFCTRITITKGSVIVIRLFIERKRRGLSQEALGRRAGLHQVVISGIEIGRRNPSSEELAALGRALGVSPTRLLDQIRVVEDPDRAEVIALSEAVSRV